jgi:hypothetical protein
VCVGAVVVGNTDHGRLPTSQIVAITKSHEGAGRTEYPIIKDAAHSMGALNRVWNSRRGTTVKVPDMVDTL